MSPGRGPVPGRFVPAARLRPWSLIAEPAAAEQPTVTLAAGERVDLGPGPVAPCCAVTLRHVSGGPVRFGLAGPAGEVLATAETGHVALVVNERSATVLTATSADGPWRPQSVTAIPLDVRRPDVLAGLRYVCAAGDGPAEVADVRAGYFGTVGFRDPQLVRHADGRPVRRDGRLVLTATNAGLGFFARAHWAVWALDPADPAGLEQVGTIFFERDGLRLTDHAGAIVLDEQADRWIVLVSSWGDFEPARGVRIRHTTVPAEVDLLSGVHVLTTDPLGLPTTTSTWDPSLARIDGRWHVAYVECPSFGPPRFQFHPALAVADGPDYADRLRPAGADASRQQTEGTLLQHVDGRWSVFASDRDRRRYRVYDLDMRPTGRVRAPYGTNIPHPLLLPGPDGSPEWLLTFDGTLWHEEVFGYGTQGDLLLYRAEVGDESPFRIPRRLIRVLGRFG